MKHIVLTALVAFASVSAPAGWYLATRLSGVAELRETMSALEQRVGELEQKTRDLTIDLNALANRVQVLEEGGAGTGAATVTYSDEGEIDTTDTLADSFAQVVLIANRRDVNKGLSNSDSRFLIDLWGLPREDLTEECQPMTNPLLKDLVKTEDVGPIRVTLIEPALLSLRQVFRNVKIYEPELYERIRSAGSLCVRHIRGRPGTVSTHAYGLSVDLNIDGKLDTLGDGKTQLGLVILADFFNKEGWYWGAGFGREDSMHFQVSREKVEQWLRQGLIRAK